MSELDALTKYYHFSLLSGTDICDIITFHLIPFLEVSEVEKKSL